MANPSVKARKQIMIVDDHALVRHGLSQLIAQETDLTVCAVADDADQALPMIDQFAPDLIVVDISLKNGNGIELIKRIKARHGEMKILVSSMHDESLFAERALHAGAMGYINKQEATDKVIESIRQVLGGEVYLSTQMTSHVLSRLAGGKNTEQDSISRLSDRELEVFELIGRGLSTRKIATQLHLSVKTIETHREHIKVKLSLQNAAELNRHAVRWVLENS